MIQIHGSLFDPVETEFRGEGRVEQQLVTEQNEQWTAHLDHDRPNRMDYAIMARGRGRRQVRERPRHSSRRPHALSTLPSNVSGI
jgi:hypothetical protein